MLSIRFLVYNDNIQAHRECHLEILTSPFSPVSDWVPAQVVPLVSRIGSAHLQP